MLQARTEWEHVQRTALEDIHSGKIIERFCQYGERTNSSQQLLHYISRGMFRIRQPLTLAIISSKSASAKLMIQWVNCGKLGKMTFTPNM